jgi:cytochrome P450
MRDPPGPPAHPVWGHLAEFREDPLGFLSEAFARHGDVVTLWAGTQRAILLREPEHLREVLIGRPDNFRKTTTQLRRLGLVLGQGLVTSEGDLWRRQRAALSPAFAHDRLADVVAVMHHGCDDLLARLDAAAGQEREVDVGGEMMRVALRVIALALFTAELGERVDRLREAFRALQHQFDRRLAVLAPWPLWVPTRANWDFRAALDEVDDLVYGLIQRCRAEPAAHRGLLAPCFGPGGPMMSDRQLRDEIVTLLLAGHENSGNSLAWTWHLLGCHPEIAHLLSAEARVVLGGGEPSLDALSRLELCKRVIQEALRLYPPAWLLLRQAREECEFGGFRVRRGALILISPYFTHRHPTHWPDPECFQPERFDPGHGPKRHRLAYLPFGAGTRKCLGAEFAQLEALLVVALVARRFQLVPSAAAEVKPRALVSLVPWPRLLMRVERVECAWPSIRAQAPERPPGTAGA